MPILGRAAVSLIVLAFVAGCTTAIDPLAIADAQTAARVKTALVNDPDLGARTIEVRVVRGVVLLSGRVVTQAEADRAVALARAVDGVADVRATLQVGDQAAVSTPDGTSQSARSEAFESSELQDNPALVALGG